VTELLSEDQVEACVGVTDFDWIALLSQQPRTNEKRKFYSIYTINVKRI
jgi:hypothetical protein